jgi:hypothetical protein
MQSRGVALVAEARVRAQPPVVTINVDCVWRLAYCPSCGRNLQDLVNASPEFFRELAKKHEKFWHPHDAVFGT